MTLPAVSLGLLPWESLTVFVSLSLSECIPGVLALVCTALQIFVSVYRNLMKLNKYTHANLSDESIFKVANSRLGWYRRCGGDVVNYLLSPKVLVIAQKDRPGLVDPLAYYLSRMQ